MQESLWEVDIPNIWSWSVVYLRPEMCPNFFKLNVKKKKKFFFFFLVLVLEHQTHQAYSCQNYNFGLDP